MKLRKLGSLVGLLSLTLVAPACGDDDNAATTDDTDDTDTTEDEDGGDTTKNTDETEESETETDETTSTEDSASSDTTETSEDTTEATTDVEGDAGEGDASSENTSDNESDASDTTGDEPDADTTSDEPDADVPPPPDCNPGDNFEYAPAEIDGDETWDCNTNWILGQDQLTVVSNGTLTIEPGTNIFGESGSGLVITNTAKIDANGQPNAPIVFSSAKAEGTREMSNWGGIVLLGKAPINVEGGQSEAEGVPTTAGYAEFGGEDEAHDCGSMSYVRIEFSGFMVSPDNELNALGVAGCGTETELHHLQAHRGSDDAFEFWGGAPQVHHLVASFMDDDSLDWTDGFTSSVQFVMIHEPGDMGIEGDNNETSYDLEPRTQPHVSNMTIAGGNVSGVLIRRGSFGKLYNSIITGNAAAAIDLRDDATLAGTEDGSLTVQNSIIYGNGSTNQFTDNAELDNGFDEEAYFSEEQYANVFDVNPNLVDIASIIAPNYQPADDTVLDGAIDPPAGMFDTTAKYIGAFEPGGEDWTAGWTAYPEN